MRLHNLVKIMYIQTIDHKVSKKMLVFPSFVCVCAHYPHSSEGLAFYEFQSVICFDG